ncbi:P-loop NTPase family protein [Xanthobacter agilis]|uniref:hypothetical protein n=1 Tax=Xanthobacter agilis TaxID=47492 RepID=UPI003726A186
MASNVAEIAMNVTGAAPARARRVSGFAVGAAALAALSLLSALPLRFTASAELAFNMAIQPPAAAVRGIAQVLGSRELARDAVERLAPADVARLATDSLFAAAAGDAAALTEQAARRVVQDVSVTPINGGRGYDIAVSAATPALAARLADAYVAAALGLDARPAPDAVSPLPGLSGGAGAAAPMLPDVPGPLPFTLLAAALATFLLGRRQHHREPLPQGLVDRAALPLQLDSPHRITWLDGPAASGLALDEAVAHLLPHAVTGPQASEPGRGRLVCVTSDGLDEAASRCARTLARRLGDDAGVVLVVLDQSVDKAGLLDLGCEAADPGVRELLVGRARFGETLHRDPHSRAHVIPPGPADEPADAARLGAVLDALRQTYDYVVVANPPLDPNDATLAESEPLVVCLTADTAPATAAVESFDALAAMRFSRIVMLRFATGEVLPPAEAEDILPPQVAPASPARGPETHPPVRRPSRPEQQDEEPQVWRGAA